MLNIAVVFGGKSVEHDISVITGTLTINTLDNFKYRVIPIYIDKQGLWFTGELNNLKAFTKFNSKKYKRVSLKLGEDVLYTIKGKKLYPLYKIDCVINCTHGYNGEDGTLSGLFKLCNIPFASPDIFASSVAIDKEYTKLFLKSIGVKYIPYKVLKRQDFLLNSKTALEKLGNITYPVIIKPARLGSSIGIAKATSFSSLNNACENCFKYDDKLLIEPLIDSFTEINCAVYKGKEIFVSQLEKPISSKDILTFKDKYEGEGDREFPAIIDKGLENKIKAISKKVYSCLDVCGIIRIDYIVKDNAIYLNEINTVPGSLAYYLFCDTFGDFACLLDELIKQGININEEYNKNLFKLDTQVLLKSGNLKK